jgi:hypothetical protein
LFVPLTSTLEIHLKKKEEEEEEAEEAEWEQGKKEKRHVAPVVMIGADVVF